MKLEDIRSRTDVSRVEESEEGIKVYINKSKEDFDLNPLPLFESSKGLPIKFIFPLNG